MTDHSNCCSHTPSSVVQSLDELDFDRGPWSAALEGDLSRLRHLLSRPYYSVDKLDSSGFTPLHYAARAGHLDIVRFLHSNGCNVNLATRSGHSTALHRAAAQGHIEIVRYLILNGADSSLKDSDGLTALQRAEQKSHTAVCKLLISHGRNG